MKFPRGIEIVTGAIAEREDGKILLTKSHKWSDKWTLAGGHVDPGETISDGAMREAKEELGLDLEFIDVICHGELIGSEDFHRTAHFIYFDIYCKLIGNDDVVLNDEHQEYKWVTPEEALKLDLAESYNKTIEAFIRYKNEI